MDNERMIVLCDEDGNDVEFEFLDLIMLRGDEYVVLLGNGGEDDEVTILRMVGENEDGENLDYEGVEDEGVLMEVFEIFRQRNADQFDFEE